MTVSFWVYCYCCCSNYKFNDILNNPVYIFAAQKVCIKALTVSLENIRYNVWLSAGQNAKQQSLNASDFKTEPFNAFTINDLKTEHVTLMKGI